MQAATGRAPAELCVPPCPVSLAYLLGMFNEMASVRRAGFSAPEPIGWADMQAWSALTETPLSSLEARLLRLLDAAWIRAWVDGQQSDQPRKAPPR